MIEDSRGKRSWAVSAGVEFPQNSVKEAKRRGFDKTTVGSVIAESGGEATDPHSFLTHGLVSRKDLLQQALRIALGQLPKKLPDSS